MRHPMDCLKCLKKINKSKGFKFLIVVEPSTSKKTMIPFCSDCSKDLEEGKSISEFKKLLEERFGKEEAHRRFCPTGEILEVSSEPSHNKKRRF